jgi:HEAT repeat protein
MGLFGPPDVDSLKAKGDVPGLIKALGYRNDDGVRALAAWSLGMIGDARAVEPLITALKDQSRSVRENAASALGKIGDARAVEPLIAALKDINARAYADPALVQFGARAVEPLIAALKDEKGLARERAAEGLVAIYRSGELDEAQKAKVLAKRAVITRMGVEFPT